MELRRGKSAVESPSPGLLELLENDREREKRAILELRERIQRKRRTQWPSFFNSLVTRENVPRNRALGAQSFSPSSPFGLQRGEGESLGRGLESVPWPRSKQHLPPRAGAELCAVGGSSASMVSSQESDRRNHDDEGQGGSQGQDESQGRGGSQGQDESQGQQGRGEGEGEGQCQEAHGQGDQWRGNDQERLLRAYQETRAALERFAIKDEPFEDKEKPETKQKGEREKEKEATAFTPLTEEEEERVARALSEPNRHLVLVQHERSNIDLTAAAIQCLRPGGWLNDDVINLYLELLKERELREPNAFLKCHFFNTFFYNKLYKDVHSYNYKAVRRWTTLNKLGYSLLQCEKIFVPIHKDVHWCLAVINVREKKFHYLDSLRGYDANVLNVLMRYLKDEAKDKLNEDLDLSDWELECPTDIPKQLNGCDCGIFMIKYVDFYSQGNELSFSQRDMGYFRRRTALELLESEAR